MSIGFAFPDAKGVDFKKEQDFEASIYQINVLCNHHVNLGNFYQDLGGGLSIHLHQFHDPFDSLSASL